LSALKLKVAEVWLVGLAGLAVIVTTGAVVSIVQAVADRARRCEWVGRVTLKVWPVELRPV